MNTKTTEENKSQESQTQHEEHGHVHGPHCNHHHALAPIVRQTPKVGRNDDCPCHSGKKFKKCCGK